MQGSVITEAVRDPSIFTKSEATTTPEEIFYPVGPAMICSLSDSKHRGSEPESLMLSGAGVSELRTTLSPKFDGRFDSSDEPPAENEDGDRISTRVILQTLGASPERPYLVEFEQFISEDFTGEDGRLDLVERDSVRRSFAGVSNGTATISDPSGEMNWQPEDEGDILKLGRWPGFQMLRIESVIDPENIVVDRVVSKSLTGLTLEMDGRSETIIATKDGFGSKGIGNEDGSWGVFAKVIDSDKVYSVVFSPGDTGKGVFTLKARALNETSSPSDIPPPTASDLELSTSRVSGFNIFDPIQNDSPGHFEYETQLITGLTGLAAYALIEVYAFLYTEAAISATVTEFTASDGTIMTCSSQLEADALAGFNEALLSGDEEAIKDAVAALQMASLGIAPVAPLATLAPLAVTEVGEVALASLATYATPPPLLDNYGNFGVYLNYFTYPGGNPWAGGDSTSPGFPGFPGSAPLQPGVRCYYTTYNSSGTPDGSPPVCFFED